MTPATQASSASFTLQPGARPAAVTTASGSGCS
jgi:hypothetical protein